MSAETDASLYMVETLDRVSKYCLNHLRPLPFESIRRSTRHALVSRGWLRQQQVAEGWWGVEPTRAGRLALSAFRLGKAKRKKADVRL